MTLTCRGDTGRVSVFLAVALTGLLAIIGLSYDAAGQVRTLHSAQLLAAEAARAAGQTVNADQVAGQGGHQVDTAAAAAAAQNYLAAAGTGGDLAFNPELTEITVTVQQAYQPLFLGLFGASEREVAGSATATLVAG